MQGQVESKQSERKGSEFEAIERLRASCALDLSKLQPSLVVLPRFSFELADNLKKNAEMRQMYTGFVEALVSFEKKYCTVFEYERNKNGFVAGKEDYANLLGKLVSILDMGSFSAKKEVFAQAIDGHVHELVGFLSNIGDADAGIKEKIRESIVDRHFVPSERAGEMSGAIATLMLAGLSKQDLEYGLVRKKHPKRIKVASVEDAIQIAHFRSYMRRSGWFEEDLNGMLAGWPVKPYIKENQLKIYKFLLNDAKIVDVRNRRLGALVIPSQKSLDAYPIRERILEKMDEYANGAYLASENKNYQMCLPFSNCDKFSGTMALAFAISIIESGVGANNLSPVGARGEMQIMPDTLRAIVNRNFEILQSYGLVPSEKELKKGKVKPEVNIACGQLHIAELLDVTFIARMLAANKKAGVEKSVSKMEKEMEKLVKKLEKLEAQKKPSEKQVGALKEKIGELASGLEVKKKELAEIIGKYEEIKERYRQELEGKWDFRAAFSAYNCGILRTYWSAKGQDRSLPFDMDRPGFKGAIPGETRLYVPTVALLAKSLLEADWFRKAAEEKRQEFMAK